MNTSRITLRPFAWTIIKAAILSVIINVILAVIGRVVSAPPDTFGPYMLGSVAGLTALGVICAALGYYAARWYIADMRRGNRWFVVCATIALIASFYPDIAMPWSTDADQVGWTYGIIANLILMHVATFGVVLWYFLDTEVAQ